MTTRTYQKTSEEISLLGFGCMRLPLVNGASQEIDYAKACELIDYAYSHGVNYFDTAYVYHGGKSEVFLGEALKKYPRESFYLADKMPGWEIRTGVEDAKRVFKTQLSRCQVDYFDFYLMHALGDRATFEKIYLDRGVLEYLDEEKSNGRIKNLGFSFHGNAEFFEYMMKFRKWDFVQIQLNYIDWNEQNAKRLYELSEEYGVQVIIMEPVRGGSLVSLCEESVNIMKDAEPHMSIASWAIRFAATPSNVLTVLSGMTAMDHVTDNVKTIENFTPLTDADYSVLSKAVAAYINKGTIPCTGCRYCMDCPAGVDIPGVFALYNKCASGGNIPLSLKNNDDFKGKLEAFKKEYAGMDDSAKPHNCADCGQCAEACPQSIKIPGKMKDISSMLKLV